MQREKAIWLNIKQRLSQFKYEDKNYIAQGA